LTLPPEQPIVARTQPDRNSKQKNDSWRSAFELSEPAGKRRQAKALNDQN
jgi:hypothetical protein